MRDTRHERALRYFGRSIIASGVPRSFPLPLPLFHTSSVQSGESVTVPDRPPCRRRACLAANAGRYRVAQSIQDNDLTTWAYLPATVNSRLYEMSSFSLLYFASETVQSTAISVCNLSLSLSLCLAISFSLLVYIVRYCPVLYFSPQRYHQYT